MDPAKLHRIFNNAPIVFIGLKTFNKIYAVNMLIHNVLNGINSIKSDILRFNINEECFVKDK